MRGQFHSLPAPAGKTLRDVRDLEGYVGDVLDRIGVQPATQTHTVLLAHGVRSAYRLERALPPETSLRAVLDEVLTQRLVAGLRHVVAAGHAESAVA